MNIPASIVPVSRYSLLFRNRAGVLYPNKLVYLSGLLSGPDALQETVTLSEAVEGIVGLAHSADEAAESVDLVVTVVTSVLVDLANGDLDRGVVLGLDDAVGGAALAWDQTVGGKQRLAPLQLLRNTSSWSISFSPPLSPPRWRFRVLFADGASRCCFLCFFGGSGCKHTGRRVLPYRSPFLRLGVDVRAVGSRWRALDVGLLRCLQPRILDVP